MSFLSSGEQTYSPSWGLGTPAFNSHSNVSLPRVDSAPTMTVLRFMSLETGGAHPQAKLPDLQLDTHLPVSLLDVRADIIGDQIVLVLVDLRNDAPESDAIYLVDWKQGQMSPVNVVSPPSRFSFVEISLAVAGPPCTTRDVRGRALGALAGARALPQARHALARALPRNAGDRTYATEPARRAHARATAIQHRLPCTHSIHANRPTQRTAA